MSSKQRMVESFKRAVSGISRKKSRSLLLGKAARKAVDALEARRLLASPVAIAGGPYMVNEGATVIIDGSASTDDGQIVAYAWDLNYKVSRGFKKSMTGSRFSYEAEDGNAVKTIALRVKDNDGNETITTTTITINDVPPDVTLTGGSTVAEGASYALSWTVEDIAPDTPTKFTIDWGDDSDPTEYGANVSSASHVYAEDGNYTITFTVTDEDGNHDTTKSVTVTPVVPQINASLNHTEINEGESVRVNFNSPNRQGTISQWIIDWGDGTTNVRPARATNSTHTYADNGNYTITVIALEPDGDTAETQLNLTVNNLDPTLSLTGVPETSPEGTAITVVKNVNDAGDDTFTYAWSLKKDGVEIATSTTSGNYTFTPTDNGEYAVTLVVTDDDGGTATESASVTVTNVSPIGLLNSNIPNHFAEGDTASFSVSVTDPGSDDTHTYQWKVEKDGEVWAIPNGTVSNTSNFTFAPDDEGSYVVSVLVADKDDGQHIAYTNTIGVTNVAPEATMSGGPQNIPGADYVASLPANASGYVRRDGSGHDTWATIVGYQVSSGFEDGVFKFQLPSNVDSSDFDAVTLHIEGARGAGEVPIDAYVFTSNSSTVGTGDPAAIDQNGVLIATDIFGDENSADITSTALRDAIRDAIDNNQTFISIGVRYRHLPSNLANNDYVWLNYNDGYPEDEGGINVPPPTLTLTQTEQIEHVQQGEEVTLAVSATDVGAADVLTYAWTATRNGVAFDLPDDVITDASVFVFKPSRSGTYVFTCVVSDGDGGIDTVVSQEIIVDNLPPTADVEAPTIDLVEGKTLAFTVDADDNGTTVGLTYAWSVTKNAQPFNLPGGVATDGTTFAFVPDDNGTYVVSVVVTDADNSSVTANATVVVINADPTGSISGQTANAVEGDSLAFTSTVLDAGSADTHTYSWSVLRNEQVFNLGGTVTNGDTFTFVPTDNGSYVVQLVVTDDDGGVSNIIATDAFMVANANPISVVTGEPNGSINEGQTISVAVQVNDPGTEDTHTYLWSVKRDGQTVALPSNVSLTTDSLSFVTTDNGTYVVSVKVTDDEGGEYTAHSTDITVNNVDPTATITGLPAGQAQNTSATLPNGSTGQVTSSGASALPNYPMAGTHNSQPVFVVHKFELPNGLTSADVDAATLAGAIWGAMSSMDGNPTPQVYLFDSASATVQSDDYADIQNSHTLLGDFGPSYSDSSNVLVTAIRNALDANQNYISIAIGHLAASGTNNYFDFGGLSLSIATQGAPTVAEGTTTTLTATASDAGADDTHAFQWSVSKDSAPFNLGAHAVTDEAEFDFTPTDNGTYLVTVVVTDDDGGTVSVTTEAIIVTNVAPTATVSGDTIGNEGSSLTFTANKNDAGADDTHTYAWSVTKNGQAYTVPNGVATNGATLTFTPEDNGTYVATVVVTDDDGGAVTAHHAGTVVANVAPTAAVTGGPGSGVTGEGSSITVGSTTADVGVLDTIVSYAWSVERDGQTFDVSSLTTNTSSFTFEPTDNGSYVIKVTVTDNDGGVGTATKTITVTNANPAALVTTQPSGSVNQGSAAAYVVAATDPGSEDVLTYAWIVKRNGVTYTLPNNVVTDDAAFTFTPTLAGSYVVTITVSDDDDGSTTVNKNLTVANVAPIISAITGTTGNVNKNTGLSYSATVVDPGSESLTYSWTIKRGNTSVSTGSGASINYTPTIAGNYTVSLTVSDGIDSVTHDSTTFTAINHAPVISSIDGVQNVNEGDSLTFSATASDADGDYLTKLWVVSREGQVALTSATQILEYVPTVDGNYTVQLTISDGTATDTLTESFFVANVAPVAQIAPLPGTITEGDVVGFVATASDASSTDTLAYNWKLRAANSDTVLASGDTLTFNWTAIDVGSYIATFEVNDGTDTTTVTREFTVANKVPTAVLNTPAMSGIIGWEQAFSLSSLVSHSGDVVTVDWNWGNGQTTLGASPSDVQSRKYDTVGTYTITATVKDDDGGQTVLTATYRVNDFGIQADPLGDGEALVVIGTNDNDSMVFSRLTNGKIRATRNGVILGSNFSVSRIYAQGEAGNDSIVAGANVTTPVHFYGGAGKDTLMGGSGDDVLLGGRGTDSMTGGAGRDILIGGDDADSLFGNDGEDLLIGGDFVDAENNTAMRAIVTEWSTTNRAFTSRVTRLRAGASGLAAYFASDRVIADGKQDILVGGADSDWIFRDTASTADTISDLTSADRQENVMA